MSREVAALLKKALSLPSEERGELASCLIESLDSVIDTDVDLAWQAEIERRIERIRSGNATMIPWDEVRRKAKAIIHEKAH
jgi:putative addiction module component (TIGR02574 family)